MSYNNFDSYGTWLAGCLIGLLMIAGWVFLGAWLGAWIWNDVIVTKFNAPTMTYIDMLLIMILARLIFPLNINYSGKK